jgi:predicted AAA+ superfamily ATPase
MGLIARHAADVVRAALDDTPVVVVNGPRQAGKSTLVRGLDLPGRVETVSLDDESVREFARFDPRGFVERPLDTLIIDEVQLEPRLFRAIKAAVDRDCRPGRFLLTGSAAAICPRHGRRTGRPGSKPSTCGPSPRARSPASAQEPNVAAIAGEIGIPAKTIDSYLALLSDAFILKTIPAWSTNLSAKVVRRPKLHLVDSGLAAHLLGVTAASSHVPSAPIGPVIETFAAMQLVRQLPWSEQRPTLWHFRDRSGKEVDLILEHPDGRIVGVEVKASSTITAGDFRGLNFLKERLGERFAYGVVLHTANEALTFGDRLAALPLSALWSDR